MTDVVASDLIEKSNKCGINPLKRSTYISNNTKSVVLSVVGVVWVTWWGIFPLILLGIIFNPTLISSSSCPAPSLFLPPSFAPLVDLSVLTTSQLRPQILLTPNTVQTFRAARLCVSALLRVNMSPAEQCKQLSHSTGPTVRAWLSPKQPPIKWKYEINHKWLALLGVLAPACWCGRCWGSGLMQQNKHVRPALFVALNQTAQKCFVFCCCNGKPERTVHLLYSSIQQTKFTKSPK